jgi:hypothetical protein
MIEQEPMKPGTVHGFLAPESIVSAFLNFRVSSSNFDFSSQAFALQGF